MNTHEEETIRKIKSTIGEEAWRDAVDEWGNDAKGCLWCGATMRSTHSDGCCQECNGDGDIVTELAYHLEVMEEDERFNALLTRADFLLDQLKEGA